MALDTVQKQSIIESFKVHEKDTGSPEVQVALLTERINEPYDRIFNRRKCILDTSRPVQHDSARKPGGNRIKRNCVTKLSVISDFKLVFSKTSQILAATIKNRCIHLHQADFNLE